MPGCSDCHDNIDSCHFCNTPNYEVGASFTTLGGCGPCDSNSYNDPSKDNLCVNCGILNSEGCTKCDSDNCLICNTGYYRFLNGLGKIVCRLCRLAHPGCEDC